VRERDEREFDDYLRGGSRVSAAYREAPADAPPPGLDEVLIERARRELRLGPKVAWSPFTRAWGVSLALAAVLVVSVTVTLVLHEQAGEPLPIPAKPAAGVPGIAPEPRPGGKDAPAAQPPAAPPAAPERARVPAAPAPFPGEKAAPAEREPRAPAVPGAPAPVERDVSRGQPAAAPASEAVPAAPALRKQAAPASRAKQEAAGEQDLGADPEVWLKRIEALRREGRHAEADALLAEFRRRFPGFPPDRLPK
jgi:hypothetical protein